MQNIQSFNGDYVIKLGTLFFDKIKIFWTPETVHFNIFLHLVLSLEVRYYFQLLVIEFRLQIGELACSLNL